MSTKQKLLLAAALVAVIILVSLIVSAVLFAVFSAIAPLLPITLPTGWAAFGIIFALVALAVVGFVGFHAVSWMRELPKRKQAAIEAAAKSAASSVAEVVKEVAGVADVVRKRQLELD